MSIRQLFDQTRPIDRQIVAVINYAADTEKLLQQEISEYEVTDSLGRHYERFMTNLSDAFQGGGGHEVGVWVSGFYGSGKSSFTKYLGFALDPRRQIGAEPFLTYLQNQFPSQQLRSQLGVLAKKFPATVIMVDLASIASADGNAQGISRLVFNKVMEWASYSKDEKIALLELMVERDERKAEFLSLVGQSGFEWAELQNDLLVANTIASEVAHQMYPTIWKNPEHFSTIKVDAIYGEDDRLRQILALIQKRTSSPRVLFILDEVGQFIEGTDRLILNLQGFAENLKNIGAGHAWIVATAQQTLPVSGPLFKLKDRFPEPLRVDIESNDIREITYRRLLKKSPEAVTQLKELFSKHSGSLLQATQLRNTKHTQAHVDAEIFARLYPFLPQHFNILMELLRSLARTTGGVGLRSTLKVIQDVLVDVGGKRGSGSALADLPVGHLATGDNFFDTLIRDLERSSGNRPLVETVAKVGAAYGVNSIHHKVAKTVAILQLIEGFPVSRHNVAAMLLPEIGATPLQEEVNEAVRELVDDKQLPLEEIDGSLRFMSEAVAQILADQASLIASLNDEQRIIDDVLRDHIFSPEPSARLENTKTVKAQVKMLRGSMPVAVTQSKEDVELHLEMVSAAEMAGRLQDRRNDSIQPTNRNVVFLLGENSHDIRTLITKIFRCEEIHRRHRTEAADKEVAAFVRAQLGRAETLKRDLDTALQNAFLKGSFVFQGTDVAVSIRGTELRVATNLQLTHVAARVFPNYKDASQNLESAAAEKLLHAPDLSLIPSAYDPLGVVEKAGAATRIRTEHPALVAIVDYLGKAGEVDGQKLVSDFNRPPFGWFKDTTRQLVAALLIAQKIRIRVAGQWLDVVGPKSIEALKNNNTFAKVDVGTNFTQIPIQVLSRASKRMLDLTGEKVLPMAPNISKAVQKEFPKLRNDYASLAVELTGAGLPGADRAQTLNKQLSQILDRDASDAPMTLGAEEASIVDNLKWAQALSAALKNGLGNEAQSASKLSFEIHGLPKVGVLEQLRDSSTTLRAELEELLSRVDFHQAESDIRQRHTALKKMVEVAAGDQTKEFNAHLQTEINQITAMPEWSQLPEDDRSDLATRLDELSLPGASNINEIRTLLNRRIEIDSSLSSVRSAVISRALEHKEKTKPPEPQPDPEIELPDVELKGLSPKKVRLKKRYLPSDVGQLKQAVLDLSAAAVELTNATISEVIFETES
ncbi:MAG: hypothetical protein JWL59_4359 [Chthoniobacteraceae bacterium]|nr:hypothetical protein [Chthoniobacteraceae bacterium]